MRLGEELFDQIISGMVFLLECHKLFCNALVSFLCFECFPLMNNVDDLFMLGSRMTNFVDHAKSSK